MSEGNLYDAKLVLTFPAEGIDEADAELDRLLDYLYEQGFESQIATLEQSIPLET